MRNKTWRRNNELPEKATLVQTIRWHGKASKAFCLPGRAAESAEYFIGKSGQKHDWST
jgi:hypothetical protein